METILFERRLGDTGQRLVVTRGPDRDPALFKSLRPHVRPELPERYYEVRIELRSPKADPVLLAAKLRVEYGTTPDKGVVIFDALVEPEDIVFATGEGAEIKLWKIQVGGGSFITPFFMADKRWTPGAAPFQLNEQVIAIKLGRASNKRLSVEVFDKTEGQHTLYEEDANEYPHFKAVRQWKEEEQK